MHIPEVNLAHYKLGYVLANVSYKMAVSNTDYEIIA